MDTVKKQTNIDKLRSMSTKDFAKFLLYFKTNEYFSPLSNLEEFNMIEYNNDNLYSNITEDLIDWLKEEVK